MLVYAENSTDKGWMNEVLLEGNGNAMVIDYRDWKWEQMRITMMLD